MTTDKTKAVLDAPETVLKRCAEIFAQHNLVNEAYEIDKYLEDLTAQALKITDAQRQEEKTCTCGAAGSGEGHTDWCDWLDVESPAVPQHVIEHGDSLDEFKSSVGIAVEACEKLAAIRDCDEPHQGNGQLKASALRQAASSLRYFANTVSSPNRNALPCETCKGNADSCADVPSLRHCEIANRPMVDNKPTDAEREKALEFGYHIIGQTFFAGWRKKGDPCLYDVWFTIDLTDICPKALQKHIDRVDAIKAALRAPAAVPHSYDDSYTTNATSGTVAVPQEVVDILDQIRKSGFVSYDGEKPHVLAVKALALLGEKEG